MPDKRLKRQSRKITRSGAAMNISGMRRCRDSMNRLRRPWSNSILLNSRNHSNPSCLMSTFSSAKTSTVSWKRSRRNFRKHTSHEEHSIQTTDCFLRTKNCKMNMVIGPLRSMNTWNATLVTTSGSSTCTRCGCTHGLAILSSGLSPIPGSDLSVSELSSASINSKLIRISITELEK